MTTTAHGHALALLLYAMNKPTIAQVERLFPDCVPGYHEELAAMIRKDFTAFWFRLDDASQRRYVSDALESYFCEAAGHADLAMIKASLPGSRS